MGGKEKELREKAEVARCDLAWLAAIHWGLRVVENGSIKVGEDLLLNRENLVNKRGELIFTGFSKFYSDNNNCVTPSDDTGHYLNKSAVVYADAIIQAFLDDTYSIIFPKKKLGGGSVGKKLDKLKDKFNTNSSYTEVNSANEVKFMAQLRHIITHNSGVIDDKFVDNCEEFKIKYDKQRFVVGDQVPLPVGEVVIPYLKHAFDFVDDHTKQLINCL